MQGTSLKSIVLGFLAGVIATLTVHEALKCVMVDAGFLQATPWDMSPSTLFGLPKIVGLSLWGGVWGSILAMIFGNVPTGSMTIRGALFGIIGPALLGAFLWIPLINGQPPFYDGEPTKIIGVLVILAGFGSVTAWLYGFFTSGCRLP